jgi:hypothetical protein
MGRWGDGEMGREELSISPDAVLSEVEYLLSKEVPFVE